MTKKSSTSTGPSSVDDRDSLPTRDRLLTGAAELFREKGYAGTTTRALSALAGIQNGSLYHHVGGKEDLLHGLCVAALNDVASLFASLTQAEGTALQRLENLARGYVELALRDRDQHATMLSEIRSLSPTRRAEVIKLRDENVDVVARLVAEAQEAGQIRSDIPAKYLTLALFNLLNWTIFWFDPEGELSEPELGAMLWSVFASGTTGGVAAAGSRPRATRTPPDSAVTGTGAGRPSRRRGE